MHGSLDINSSWDARRDRSAYGYRFTSGIPTHSGAGSEEICIQFHPPRALPAPGQSKPWIHHITETAPHKKIWFTISRKDEDFLLRFDRCGDFLVKPRSRTIECTPALIADKHTLRHVLINQVIPRMLSQLGEIVLHASAISLANNNIAVAFMGESGAGKSTLAAWFCRKGAALLTDDCLRLVVKDNQFAEAIPSYPAIRIWPDSLERVAYDFSPETAPVKNCYNDKLQYANEELNLNFCESPSPLTAIFLLSPRDSHANDIEIIKASQKNTLAKMISNCFRLDVEDKSLLGSEFRKLINLAITMPAFEIKYPKNWGALEKIHSLVLEELDKIT